MKLKDIPGVMLGEKKGKHEKCWEIDIDYCIPCGETVDIHPEKIRGFNQALTEQGEVEVVVDVEEARKAIRNSRAGQALFLEVSDVVLEDAYKYLAQAISDNLPSILKVKK